MKLPELTIGRFKAKIPIVQGGMSVRVSTSSLAAAVADCGGIGTIGGSGIPIANASLVSHLVARPAATTFFAIQRQR